MSATATSSRHWKHVVTEGCAVTTQLRQRREQSSGIKQHPTRFAMIEQPVLFVVIVGGGRTTPNGIKMARRGRGMRPRTSSSTKWRTLERLSWPRFTCRDDPT